MSGNTTVDRAEMAKAAQQIEEKAGQIHQTQQTLGNQRPRGPQRLRRLGHHVLPARAVATSLMNLQHKVEDATASAHASLIPWDSDTAWHVEQRKLDLFDYLIGSLVDGTLFVDPVATLNHYNSAQKAAEYDITTGSVRVVKTISAQSWETTQQQTQPMPAVYHGAVSASVHQFDVWMEYQALNTGVHEAVSKAADRVELSLIDFLAVPSTATSPTYTGKTTTTGLGSGSSSTATMPGAGDSTNYANGYTAPGASGTGAVGGVESNVPLTSLMGGQALMGGRNVRKKDDSSEEIDETWLEEDQDVWGTSGSRIDGVSF